MSGAAEEATAALDAWLAEIGRAGWRGARLAEAAREAGLEPARLAAIIADPVDALAAFLSRIARESAAAAAGGSGSVRDRLFDGIMAGFDVLQAHRPAVEALIRSRDPAVPLIAVGRALSGVRRLAASAGIEMVGPEASLRLAALLGLIARAFRAWRRDESEDMSATMAALDRLLDEAERVATGGLRALLPAFPFLGRTDRAPAPTPDPPAE